MADQNSPEDMRRLNKAVAGSPKALVDEPGETVEPIAPEGETETTAAAKPAPGSDRTKISASRGLAEWLAVNSLSLALTSYQTGQLILVGTLPGGRLSVHERNFVRAMGLCATSQRLYLATIAQIWRLDNVLRPGQRANENFDRLYVPRSASTTGDIDTHEIAVDSDGQLVFVNTKYSCLATLSDTHSFKPLWKPKHISRLAPEDRCHLNGLAMDKGKPRYVTAVSRSDVVDGWRERRGQGGVVIDVTDDRVVSDDLSMPHSPRLANDALWVLDSGRGNLCRVDQTTGRREPVAFCPGFMRGLSFWRHFAAIGTSLPRESTFKGLELDAAIAARDSEPRCGLWIVDTRNGDIAHWLRFDGGIRELFDVSFVPNVRTPMCVGLASPEMRTLITYDGEPLGDTPAG